MTAANTLVRPATQADYDAIQAMLATFTVQHHIWQPEQFRREFLGFTPAIFRRWLDTPDELNLAAELGSAVVGFASASRFKGRASDITFARRGVHVSLLLVAPSAQRRGVGRALLKGIQAWADEFEAEFIGLNMSPMNATARAFYAALGYDLHAEYRTKTLRGVKHFEADP
jgi:GNAT superfamily N-acetyltransferase